MSDTARIEDCRADAVAETVADHPIVLFDGVCHLCHRTVRFILPRDRAGRFRFAPLQSVPGRALLQRHGRDLNAIDAVVLIDADGLHQKSDATLRVMRHLSGGWPMLSLLLWVPSGLRNLVYDFVARHRYQWFGRSEQCSLPLPEWRDRFLA